MRTPTRIPLWLPAIVTLLVATGVRYQNFREQERAIVTDLVRRKAIDARLIADYLGATMIGVNHSENQQQVVARGALSGRHGNTNVLVQVEMPDGRSVELANNIDDLKPGLFDGARPEVDRLAAQHKENFPRQGLRFRANGQNYILHRSIFSMSAPRDKLGGGTPLIAEALLATNLDAATIATRQTALFWGTTLIILVAIGITCVILINVLPFETISRAVTGNLAIERSRLWPRVAEDLATAIETYRSENAAALARAKALTEEVETVNHIAAHDVKADLTALVKGSEVITETIDELLAYLGESDDEVLLDAIATIQYFSGLNINSARNAFDVLDQRNKLYDLKSKIVVGPCAVADIFKALESSFASESGELRVINNCPNNRKILADFSLLLAVLKNIVRNGFVHNDSPLKRVEVRVGPSGHRSHIVITDNGVGMPDSYLESWGKVLGKAAQLAGRGGSGVGLYSIRRIVEAHPGASIEVKSTVGQGTQFILEFPHVA